jgi:hypothetical protein
MGLRRRAQSCDDGGDDLGEERDKLDMLHAFILRKSTDRVGAHWVSYARDVKKERKGNRVKKI